VGYNTSLDMGGEREGGNYQEKNILVRKKKGGPKVF